MHDALTYAINGALFAVYNELGNIWQEEVYEQALQIELEAQGFRVERQKEFEVFYFDRRVGHYRIDLLVEDAVIVEIKAVPHTFPLHKAQLISYLKSATYFLSERIQETARHFSEFRRRKGRTRHLSESAGSENAAAKSF